MLPSWLTPVLTIAGMIFSAGITWGVITYRQKKSEESTTNLVKELKECVTKLQTLVIEVQVMRNDTTRMLKEVEEHDKRIGALEVMIAKVSRTTTGRKR